MKRNINLALIFGALIIAGIETQKALGAAVEPATETSDRYKATDAVLKVISGNLAEFKPVAVIDHSRLALKEGVTMPPSVVSIYSDPSVDAALMKANPRVGLDLPQKILVFEETGKLAVAYPSSDFLAKRHGITDTGALKGYDTAMNAGLRGVDDELLAVVGGDGVTRDYGITELVSEFPHAETIKLLKDVVMKQGDTVWFGELDLKGEAAAEGEELPKATLLLFGGPKPGGVAMAKFPKLGLDAFCQKLLVYEEADGAVKVIFNDIVAMAKLHYGTSARPHHVINDRLTKTFESAVKSKAE